MHLLRITVASLLLATVAAAQRVEFVEGDVTQLKCTVDVVGDAKGLVLARVKVRNRTRHQAEPMAFRLRGPAKRGEEPAVVEAWRAPLPHVRRHGRAIAPGGSGTYWIQFTAWKGPARYTAKVTRATFHGGPPIPKPKVSLGTPQRGHWQDEFGRYPELTIDVRHDQPMPLDLVFMARATTPVNGRVLVHARVPPADGTRAVLRGLKSRPFQDESETSGFAASHFELIDWTTVEPGNAEAGAELAVPALRSLVWWPDDHPTVEASFDYAYRNDGNQPPTGRATGRFRIHRHKVAVIDSKGDDLAVTRAAGALTQAFGHLLRSDPDRLKSESTYQLFAPGWVAIGGANVLNESYGDGRQRFEIRDRRIVGMLFNQVDERWLTVPMGEQWAISSRLRSGLVPTRRQYSWTSVAGLPIPLSYVQDTSFADGSRSFDRLRIAGAEITAAPPPLGPPTGAVDALRAAWEAAYRYPATPVTLAGAFEFRNDGSHPEWRGKTVVTGRVVLHGFRGWSRWRRPYERADVTLDGEHSEDVEESLRSLVLGRMGMWGSRDFCGRQSFDAAFGGAVIGAAKSGWFSIRDAAFITGVGVTDGVAHSVRAGAARWDWTLKAYGQDLLPVRVRYGTEAVIEVVWRNLGDGWWLPSAVTYKKTMGPAFGTEKLRWKKLELR